MKIKIIIGSMIILCLSNELIAQKAYLELDTLLIQGIEINEGDSSDIQYVEAINKGITTRYKANEIVGYGLEDGRKYVSKNLNDSSTAEKVFMQELVKGKISLFYYSGKGEKRFFVEKDSSGLIQLEKRYKELLSDLMQDRDWIFSDIKKSRLGKTALSKLVSMYNADRPAYYPHARIGIAGGYLNSNLKASSKLENPLLENVTFESNSSWMIGVSADIPIERSKYSFVTGIYFLQRNFLAKNKNAFLDVDAVINSSSIEVPLLARFTTSAIKLRWFSELGVTTTFNYENKHELYSARIDGNVIFINEKSETPMLSSNMNALTLGTGFQYQLNSRMVMSLGTRIDKYFGSKDALSINQFKIYANITF